MCVDSRGINMCGIDLRKLMAGGRMGTNGEPESELNGDRRNVGEAPIGPRRKLGDAMAKGGR